MEEIIEVTYEQLSKLMSHNDLVIVIAHTPTCGTCQVAKKMLMVIQTMLKEVKIVSINLNYNEKLAHDEEIMSVPCILVYQKAICVERIYAFESVPFLYKKITSYL